MSSAQLKYKIEPTIMACQPQYELFIARPITRTPHPMYGWTAPEAVGEFIGWTKFESSGVYLTQAECFDALKHLSTPVLEGEL